MTRRQILAALQGGQLSVAEARRAIVRNGFDHDAPVESPALGQLQAELAASLAEALYMAEGDVAHDANFTDLGLDSIVGVEWVNRVNRRYGIKVPATKVYDYPTIEKFAEYVRGVIRPAQTSPTKPAPPRRSAGNRRPRPAARPGATAGRIAIVGMAGRFPGAPDLAHFWENLAAGRSAIREIPRERWNADDYFDPDPEKPGKIYCKWLGALDDIDRFDPAFFQISAAEAETMDPQYRIFLEQAHRAFEDAGYSATALSNRKCGVYMGVMSGEYVHLLPPHLARALNTGNSPSIAAARVSYFLNLKGPAIPIDTACSSSLVATHLACQALRNGEIDMGLVGGVTLYLTPASFIGMCAAGMLSPDGQCRTFDNGANGFVPGEGAAALVLKRLEDAERDHDCIHGVILGSGINQDGRTNGITAPSVQSQIELERDVYARFRIDPATIDYVEAHGTGTKLGDPVELEALTTVFRERTTRRKFCGLGSVKSNIGHTSAAAGMAGVQKMLLCFQHRTLVPTLHFREANAHCDFEDSPFYVNTEAKPWPAPAGGLRRAAISSMGFSGTNAHVVIEEYPRPAARHARADARRSLPLILSAKNETRLREMAQNLIDHFKAGDGELALGDVAFTLQVGRDAMEERLGIVAATAEEAVAKLGAFLAGRADPDVLRGRVPRVRGRLALVEPDEAMARTIAGWFEQGQWSPLLARWVGGLVIDWTRLHAAGDERPYRVSLPTYPFARERYWVQSGEPARAPQA
ncbi:MAG TPA: beta-ketoacyl synthase N-terminal-like domain-containing protein, partial [Opitutus sp.]|nr:beta-ketoacyl synthase N-terminal-like domain-containing protein [Opitutus sp.]